MTRPVDFLGRFFRDLHGVMDSLEWVNEDGDFKVDRGEIKGLRGVPVFGLLHDYYIHRNLYKYTPSVTMLGGNVYQLENDEPLLDHIKFRLVGFDHVVMAMNPVAGRTHVILAGFKNGELRTSEFIAEDMERAFENAITTLKEARPEPGGIRLMGRNIQDLRSDPTAIGNVRSAQGVGEWDNLVVNIANIGNSIMEYRAVVISLKDGNLKVHQVENVSLAHAVTGALEGLWFSKPVRIVKK